MPLVPRLIPSVDRQDLKAAKRKYVRMRKALGRLLEHGDSIATQEGPEQWMPKDEVNYKEYRKR